MDKHGTVKYDLAGHWPLYVSVNGYEWVQGQQVISEDFNSSGLFLVSKPGPTKEVKIPEDLYVQFAELKPKPESTLQFAKTYGRLTLPGSHFHQDATMQSAEGDEMSEWQIQVGRLKAALDLWYAAKEGDKVSVRAFLAPKGSRSGNWMLPFPSAAPRSPIEHAKAIVVTTVNQELAPTFAGDTACVLPGCGFSGPSRYRADDTRAYLRLSPEKGPELLMVSTNLKKTIWLQFAAAITGERKVKRCEAPDCGRYMDVTSSARPGARRMHPKCEERLRKRRFRATRERIAR